MKLNLPSHLEAFSHPQLDERGISLFIKRDDLIHPDISGNKWRKLRYNIQECQHRRKEGVITFGGAYSNHLVATASACKLAGLKSIGLVRGDELNSESNESLKACTEFGMELHFLERAEYELRESKEYCAAVRQEFDGFYLVPEGGANYYGMIGCQEILKEIDLEFDDLYVAQGTSTTSCGLLMGLKENQCLHVVPALKGYQSKEEMQKLILANGLPSVWFEDKFGQVQIHDRAHFGGYAKVNDELINFMQDFHAWSGIKLDPIYTAKVAFELWQNVLNGELDGKTLIFLHTGGLQGIKGIESKRGEKIYV